MPSSTVTMEVQVETLPFISVMVRVTLLAPISAQVKALRLIVMFAIPQLSVLPLSISAAEIDVFPLASNCTVMFLQSATGSSLSFMVTLKEQVCIGFIPSSYSKVLVVVPMGKVLPLGRPDVWVRLPPPLQPVGVEMV